MVCPRVLAGLEFLNLLLGFLPFPRTRNIHQAQQQACSKASSCLTREALPAGGSRPESQGRRVPASRAPRSSPPPSALALEQPKPKTRSRPSRHLRRVVRTQDNTCFLGRGLSPPTGQAGPPRFQVSAPVLPPWTELSHPRPEHILPSPQNPAHNLPAESALRADTPSLEEARNDAPFLVLKHSQGHSALAPTVLVSSSLWTGRTAHEGHCRASELQ